MDIPIFPVDLFLFYKLTFRILLFFHPVRLFFCWWMRREISLWPARFPWPAATVQQQPKEKRKKSNLELFTTFGKIKINKKEIFPSCFLSAFLFHFHHTSSFSQLTTAGPNILYYTPPTDPHPPDLYLAARPCWDDEAIEWKPKVKHKKSENVVLAGLESPRPFYFHFFGIFVLEKPPVKKSWNEFQTRKWFYLYSWCDGRPCRM